MKKIFRCKKNLIIIELYFSKEILLEKSSEDIQSYLQSSQRSESSTPFITSIIDLRIDEVALLKAVRKNYVYEIRRATEKDLVSVKIINHPSVDDIQRYANFFSAFANSKHLGEANISKLIELAKNDALVLAISCAPGNQQIWLCAHAYITDGYRARLLYSASNIEMIDSTDRQLIGRANKHLHWNSITYFKNADYQEYDLGGISKSEALKQIDEFKEAFGGVEVIEYNLLKGVTLKGKLALLGFKVLTIITHLKHKMRS
jgi:lipid II:glycine glycyltransferase (peptidoglycan interpeptide bridge formation enzyme)